MYQPNLIAIKLSQIKEDNTSHKKEPTREGCSLNKQQQQQDNIIIIIIIIVVVIIIIIKNDKNKASDHKILCQENCNLGTEV